MKKPGADFWSGLALAALGAYIVLEASRWEYIGNDGPGPGFLPLWYGIGMLGLSLLLMGTSFRATPAIDWRGAGRAFGAWGAFAAAGVAMKWLGFVACFAALTFFVISVMYRRPLAVAALVAAVSAAAFYLLFQVALDVKLPPWNLRPA